MDEREGGQVKSSHLPSSPRLCVHGWLGNRLASWCKGADSFVKSAWGGVWGRSVLVRLAWGSASKGSTRGIILLRNRRMLFIVNRSRRVGSSIFTSTPEQCSKF
eukprot:182046-Prymnesium_polylepis.1